MQDVASVDEFLNVTATKTVPLVEHLEFEFLLEYDVFVPSKQGEHEFTSHQISFTAFSTATTRTSTAHARLRELQHTLVWYYCGLTKPPSRDTVDRFLTDLEHVIDDVFAQLVEQAAGGGLLDSTYSIDSTHIEAIQYNDAASWNYDPTAEEYYYGFGCTIVSTGSKILIAAEFTQAKQAPQETAIWMFGDSAYDILDWYDLLLAVGVVPVAQYNPRNTDDPLDIECRVEDRIEKHGDVQLKQSVLDETYNRRTGVERTYDAVKECGPGHVRARGRVHGVCSLRCISGSSLQSPTSSGATIRVVRNSSYETDSMTRSSY